MARSATARRHTTPSTPASCVTKNRAQRCPTSYVARRPCDRQTGREWARESRDARHGRGRRNLASRRVSHAARGAQVERLRLDERRACMSPPGSKARVTTCGHTPRCRAAPPGRAVVSLERAHQPRDSTTRPSARRCGGATRRRGKVRRLGRRPAARMLPPILDGARRILDGVRVGRGGELLQLLQQARFPAHGVGVDEWWWRQREGSGDRASRK